MSTQTNTKATAADAAATTTAAAATAKTAAPPKKSPMETKAGAAAAMPPYEDFEPLCGWRREEGQETLVIHIPEFKREQLNVSISSGGILKISGERPIDGSKSSHFSKKIEISKDCNASEISAKFTSAGLLSISMPKKTVLVPKQDQQPTPPVTIQENQLQQKPQETQDQGAKKLGGVTVVVAVAVAVVAVALGAYATYKYRSMDS
ncbi:hypothetical protein ACSBR2_020495 [Camellia fascicularis]